MAYFTYLSILSFGVSRHESSIYPFSSSWLSPHGIVVRSVYGDPISFLKAAIDIASTGWYSPSTQWVSNLWPPGFVIVEAIIIKSFGMGVALPFILQVISCLLFAVILTILCTILRLKYAPRFIQYVLPTLIFAPVSTRSFYLGPYGVLFGETFAAFFLALGLLTICLAGFCQKKTLYIVIGSAAVGASAYFRSQFEIYANFIIIVYALAGLVTPLLFLRPFALKAYLSGLKPWLIGLLICVVVMLPWRVYRMIHLRSTTWVSTSELTYKASVSLTQDLRAAGGDFIIKGGGNLSCLLDPSICGKTAEAKSLFFQTLIHHFPSWVRIKLSLLPRYAFADYRPDGLTYPSTPVNFLSAAPHAALLGLFSWLVIYSAITIARSLQAGIHLDWTQVATFLFVVAISLASLPIMLLSHFEVRYFFSPWFLLAIATILLIPRKFFESCIHVLPKSYESL